ncbi:helix-turn-helix domain-containing protein [Aquimarina brevivitae]|nr:helix-turn-helix domain-containing protein [Aquimarina brevivitae]
MVSANPVEIPNDSFDAANLKANGNSIKPEVNYKKLALYNAKLGNAEKTAYYLENYIKSNADISFINNTAFDAMQEDKSFRLLKDKYFVKVDFWSLFCLYVGFIGIFVFSVLILKQGGDLIARLLIASFLMLHSLFIIRISAYMANYDYRFPHALYITAAFSFLYGPIIYFYFKRTLEGYTFRKIDLIHLAPTLLFIILLFPVYSLPEEEKLLMILNNERPFMELIAGLKVLSIGIYAAMAIRLFLKSQKQQYKFTSSQRRWQKHIIIFSLLYLVSYTIYVLLLKDVFLKGFFFHLQIISMSLIVLYISYYSTLNFTAISTTNRSIKFDDKSGKELNIAPIPAISLNEGVGDIVKNKTKIPSNRKVSSKKYKKSNLTRTQVKELKKKLLFLMDEEKVYRINDLTLPKLANLLGTSRNSTSQIINESFGLNFFELINRYRIEEAKEIFKSENDVNIIDVAYEVGYNNKVTFNKSFKRYCNITPTEYIRSKISMN